MGCVGPGIFMRYLNKFLLLTTGSYVDAEILNIVPWKKKEISMKKFVILIVAVFVTVSLYAAFKNLKFFPTNIAEAELTKTMNSIAAALGVKCNHCHDINAFDKDTGKKMIGRGMFMMVKDINSRNSASLFANKRIGCITCHNGQIKPKTL
jgi:hypothetical protein